MQRGIFVRKLKHIYLIIGKSGSGKTTVQNRLFEVYKLVPLISYTTRKPRYEGEGGHIFVSKSEFDTLEHKIAYTKFDDNEYCATSSQIDNSDIYIIDAKGIDFLKNNYHGDKKFKVIYLDASIQTCIERMTRRGDSSDSTKKRIENDEVVFNGVKEIADLIIKTDTNSVNNIAATIWNFIEKTETGI